MRRRDFLAVVGGAVATAWPVSLSAVAGEGFAKALCGAQPSDA